MSLLPNKALPICPKRILAIADLHLRPGDQQAIAQLEHFLQRITRPGDALFILGDLFDAWIGPELMDDYPRLIETLGNAVTRGVWIGFVEGNRDFLLSEPFFQLTGVHSLSAKVTIEFHGIRYLFLHGDQFCLKDSSYRLLYETTRQRSWQENILRLPRAKREEWVTQLREKTEARQFSPEAYLQEMVTVDDVIEQCAAHQADVLIYGHFHCQQTQTISTPNRSVTHWCLPEWNAGLGYLLIDADSLPQFKAFRTAESAPPIIL